MKIYKYKLQLIGQQQLIIPSPQKFLSFQKQGDDFCVWYEVDIESGSRDVIDFMITATGYEVPSGTQYLGTVLDGGFVWHLYARAG